MWQLVALLVYADSGSAVEKPKDDAEAPLLTTFDGVEFPSTERPIKLIHGRASFKLKISQVFCRKGEWGVSFTCQEGCSFLECLGKR